MVWLWLKVTAGICGLLLRVEVSVLSLNRLDVGLVRLRSVLVSLRGRRISLRCCLYLGGFGGCLLVSWLGRVGCVICRDGCLLVRSVALFVMFCLVIGVAVRVGLCRLSHWCFSLRMVSFGRMVGALPCCPIS